MPRYLAVVLALAVPFALTGCGGSSDTSSTSTSGSGTAGSTGTSSSATTTTTAGTTGASCQSGADCANVPCSCNDGEVINYTGCNNGVCATGAGACNSACEDHGGWNSQGTTGTSGQSTSGGTNGTSGAPGVNQACTGPDFRCATGLICVVNSQGDIQGLCRHACDANDTFACDGYEGADGASYECCDLGNGSGACVAFGSCN